MLLDLMKCIFLYLFQANCVNLSRKWGLKLHKHVFQAHPVKEEQLQEGEAPIQTRRMCQKPVPCVPSFHRGSLFTLQGWMRT